MSIQLADRPDLFELAFGARTPDELWLECRVRGERRVVKRLTSDRRKDAAS